MVSQHAHINSFIDILCAQAFTQILCLLHRLLNLYSHQLVFISLRQTQAGKIVAYCLQLGNYDTVLTMQKKHVEIPAVFLLFLQVNGRGPGSRGDNRDLWDINVESSKLDRNEAG
nr:hypothetical protein BaRGS_016192 [Batillaria attramentaria]